MAVTETVLYLEPGSVLETGVWCRGCALPAAMKIEILQLTGEGFRMFATALWCDGCSHLCHHSDHGCGTR